MIENQGIENNGFSLSRMSFNFFFKVSHNIIRISELCDQNSELTKKTKITKSVLRSAAEQDADLLNEMFNIAKQCPKMENIKRENVEMNLRIVKLRSIEKVNNDKIQNQAKTLSKLNSKIISQKSELGAKSEVISGMEHKLRRLTLDLEVEREKNERF